MTVLSVLDAAGRRRSPATLPGYHAGRPPRNKGMRYPADPPTVDEIVAVMRHTRDDRHGARLRAAIVVLEANAAFALRSPPGGSAWGLLIDSPGSVDGFGLDRTEVTSN